MNRLELVKDAADKAGIGGGGPSVNTTTGAASSEVRRLISNVDNAWLEIQLMKQQSGQYWRWMRREFELRTNPDQHVYAYTDLAIKDRRTEKGIDLFRNWLIKDYGNPPFLWRRDEGEGAYTYLTYVTYDNWRLVYSEHRHAPGHPIVLSISPQNELVIGPVPDNEYVVQGSYMQGVQRLKSDEDEPGMPEDFHLAIVWKAVAKQGMFDAAHETVAWAEKEYSDMIWALTRDQASVVFTGGPLC